jgi:NAD-dependent dihydropyrimidine dehydrogenase PreA subunit
MRYIEDVVTLKYDGKLCNGCGRCVQVCPHAVFALVDKRAVMADRGACMECGACAKNCEPGAIQVRAGVGCAAAVLASAFDTSKASRSCSEKSASCC